MYPFPQIKLLFGVKKNKVKQREANFEISFKKKERFDLLLVVEHD